MHAKVYDRTGQPVVFDRWVKPQTNGFHEFILLFSILLQTVLELYHLEIHQKKAGPDYHRLKTMVKRSVEQDLQNRNLGGINGNYERNAMVKNQGTK